MRSEEAPAPNRAPRSAQASPRAFSSFVQHVGCHAGQADLRGRVTAAAGIEVDLHIEHGNGRAFDQVNLRAAGLSPVLHRNRRQRGSMHKKACSPR